MVFDKRIDKEDVYLHYGLGFDIELHAKDKKEAKIIAENTVINFLALITYLEGCYADLPTMVLSYRKPDRNFWLEEYQGLVFDNSYRPVETSLRPINLSRLNEFIKSMKSLNPEIRSVVDGALHWFWKVLGSKDLRDRFINLWISLEFLEELLKQKLNLPRGKIKKQPVCLECRKTFSTKCPYCNKKYYYEAPIGKAGYKKLEKKITEKIMKFEELHSFRSSLFHPSIKSKKTKKEYEYAIYSARVFLNYAVAFLLGLDLKEAGSLARSEIRTLSLPIALEFMGRVKVSKELTVDDVDGQPSIKGDYRFKYEFVGEDIDQLPDVKHTFQGAFETGQVKKIVKIDSSHNIKKVWERK